jgi:glycosyltransferase involved in cell wall biosynthesis
MLARMSSRTAAISYCSRISADQHESLGFDPERRVVIPNGVDCDEFRPRVEARARLTATFGIPAGRLIIGNVARAHPMKNHEGFVRTLARLHKDGYDVHGLIIGAGHEEGAARQAARALGIDDRLSTPGPRSDVAEFLSGLDLFLLSSAWGEAFPLSVAEAMASGVPVVVTDVGDCGWLVGRGELVARPKDPEAQAATVRRILDLSPSDRKSLGMAGRERVAENFSIKRYTERHVQLYETALAGSDRRRSAA